jgi:septum site-determining protein MinC
VSTTNPPKSPAALDFKSATLYTVRVVLHDHNLPALVAALDQRMSDAGSLFENEPVVIDASGVEGLVEWEALIQALRGHALHPIGVIATDNNLEAAQACGLPAVDLSAAPVRPASTPVPDKDVPVVAPMAPPQLATQDVASPAVAPAAMVVHHQLRSGQRIYARNTDLIVIGVVNRGAEVIADGNIHVYGALRGKAMAGARGDASARIFTTSLDPELLAIAGVYRVIETQLDKSLHKQAAIVRLEGDSLHIASLDSRI